MAVPRWFGRGKGATLDEATLDLLRRSHLLLVPQQVGVDRIAELVRTRVPAGDLAAEGRVRLGRTSTLVGPFEVEVEDAVAAKVPAPWRVAYAVETPVERDEAGFEHFHDPVHLASWMRAFPTGPPYREEGDAVELALAVARGVGGSVRISGSNAVLTPDPDRVVDHTVWSPYWVDHERMLDLLGPVLPGAHMDLGGSDWSGPKADAPDERPWELPPDHPDYEAFEDGLTEADRDAIDAVAEAADIIALSGDDVVDGYAVYGDSHVEVQVQAEEAVPGWLRERLAEHLASPDVAVVTYAVRWLPEDVAQLDLEEPSPEFVAERERVRPWVRAAARVVAEATDGVVLDADGFPVDRYRL